MNWAWEERDYLAELLGEQALIGLLPVLMGLVLALPLGVGIARSDRWRLPVLIVAGFVQVVPALTVFVILPALLDTTLSARVNVIVALTLLVLATMTRVVADAVRAVPEQVRLVADGIGLSPGVRVLRVELPVALPAIIAGLRAAAVTALTLATASAIVGVRSLGTLFTEGFEAGFETEVLVGLALVGLSALAVDLVLVRGARLFAPWSRLVPIR